MKILVVCQYYHPEPFRISDICESLVYNGHEVTVLTGLPNYPEGKVLDGYRFHKKRKENLNGVKILRSFEIGRGNTNFGLFLNYISFALSASIKALFIKDKFDVVFVNQLSPVLMSIPGIVYKRKNHKKMLLYCLDLWPDSLVAGGITKESIVYKLFLRVSKWIYNSADQILVTSSMFKDYFEEVLNIDTTSITHLPQYAEDLFSPTTTSSAVKGIESNYVFAGNIGDVQSVETIVRAANELKNRQDIMFHIVGDGSKLEYCQRLSKNFNLDNIIFYGRRPVEEMPEFYEIADAMLVTLKDIKTLSYTLPGKVQSYMASGKPIIAAIDGETKRVIEDAKCGLCCSAEDHKGLAQLILEFEGRRDKTEMSNNALDFYKSNYNKENFMTILQESLKRLRSESDV